MFTRFPRRAATVVIAMVLLVGMPLGVMASHLFDDVPTSHLFHADIEAIALAGVTQGCDANSYCPEALVTRGQMAAFLNRLGALAPGKSPVVNADRVDGYQANATGRVAYRNVESTLTGTATTGRIAATIVAPSRGWIVISGSGYVFNTSTDLAARARCHLEVNDAYVLGSVRGVDTDYRPVAGALIDEQVCATNGGYEVCAAGTYTIDLEFQLPAALDILQSSLIAHYSPFGGTGTQPSCTSSAPPALVEPPQKDAE